MKVIHKLRDRVQWLDLVLISPAAGAVIYELMKL